jgi:hypothetical protein
MKVHTSWSICSWKAYPASSTIDKWIGTYTNGASFMCSSIGSAPGANLLMKIYFYLLLARPVLWEFLVQHWISLSYKTVWVNFFLESFTGLAAGLTPIRPDSDKCSNSLGRFIRDEEKSFIRLAPGQNLGLVATTASRPIFSGTSDTPCCQTWAPSRCTRRKTWKRWDFLSLTFHTLKDTSNSWKLVIL